MIRFVWLISFMALTLSAETSLWKLMHAGKTLYLGGTVHVLGAKDYPLPQAFESAFHDADKVVFETDIGATNSPQHLFTMQNLMTYPAGKSLKKSVSRRAYHVVEAYANKSHIPMMLFDRMKPQLILMTVLMTKLQQIGMASPGVDRYYYDKAVQQKKSITWFESVDQQLSYLAKIGQENESRMLIKNFEMMDQVPTLIKTMIFAWRIGDDKRLVDLNKKFLMSDSPADYRRLVVDRNKQWMKTIKKMIRTRETELILVGTLHLVGKDGIVSQLRRMGYRVIQQ